MDISILKNIIQSLPMVLPEAMVAALILLLTIACIIPWKKPAMVGKSLSWIFGIGYILLKINQWNGQWDNGFLGMISLDNYRIAGQLLLGGLYLFSLHLSAVEVQLKNEERMEYWLLKAAILLGGSALVMSDNLLMIYLAVELLSLSAYGLTAFSFNKKGNKAALKYLLFGAIASALTVYGMSILYGLTGTLSLTDGSFWTNLSTAPVSILAFAAFLAVIGLLFKLTAVPLHPWVEDVYQNAPTPIAALFATLPKIAAFFCFMGIMQLLPPLSAEAKQAIIVALGFIALVSMTAGNLLALGQKEVKKMLAYSSVSHAGFLIACIIVPAKSAWDAGLFYAVIYGIMNMAAFGLVQYFETGKKAITYEDFNGMGKKHALWGIGLVIVMISLTGLPPTAGFNAKLMVFLALWEQYETTSTTIYLLLLVFGVLNTVIALFYYIRLPYHFYFQEEGEEDYHFYRRREVVIENRLQWAYRIALFVAILPLIVLFFAPQIIL
ncbi:NADH-quinone oxidoreductase subunit N [Persicobacter diffluens]|uniref:NADH-quinone oxidoreductase subunit N n=1 Tax=Persicobacter diffluens TaxID=981 RepID=A0AAN4VXR5_9BACT|nr:NADH-quinone oxidoreductase subunit N [Persicobacter diffluens]